MVGIVGWLVLWVALVLEVHAATVTTHVHVLCTNENYHHSPYCQGKPLVENGEFTGYLDTGAAWSYSWLSDRVLKFEVERAFWYVIDGKQYWLESDLQALSISWYGTTR